MNFSDPLDCLYPFPNEVIIEHRESAIDFAKHMLRRGRIERCLVMWVDGSAQPRLPGKRVDRISASAVGWLDFSSNNWTESVTLNSLEHSPTNVNEAELVAIQEAFRTACDQVNEFDRLVIFSDSQCALKGLRNQSNFPFIPNTDAKNSILRYANQLYDVGIIVELRWVPGHSRVEGNERVDKLARRSGRLARHYLSQKPLQTKLRHVTITADSSRMLRKNLRKLIVLQLREEEKAIISKKDLIP